MEVIDVEVANVTAAPAVRRQKALRPIADSQSAQVPPGLTQKAS